MATVLELAREVRHRLVSGDTGCLTIDYTGETVAIHFLGGNIVTGRASFLSCFSRNPEQFQFKFLDRLEQPAGSDSTASLLIEAIDSIDPRVLVQVWEPYAQWRIGFRQDPQVHNTFIRDHLSSEIAVLRRITRLAVSGSISLEAPNTLITDEIRTIELAYDGGGWLEVLGVTSSADDVEIKKAYRKLARRFHPDRWVTATDVGLRNRIEKTFKMVSHAYAQLQMRQPHPVQCAIGPELKTTFWQKLFGLAWLVR